MASNSVRIDKWLWAVRIFKTRSLASEACRKGRVEINGVSVKPSREIKENEVILVRKTPVNYHYKVLQLTEKRMGAKLVPEFMEDITPAENLEVLEMQKLMAWSDRSRGEGRPTKKDRREIDRLFND
ncbi:MAG: RNA-binding S4 domain-containing protein [Prolixibacteraceae bacterium]|nr:RNA-binding S4 domain-containing protein [Prolixibacteraceae bacterium]MBN2650572.1 RNA-binding S4 domain-containing protein [Prolixibacteraceae bacterium]